ncbi:AEC family transporter [Thermosipho ferrireducens]|uniref:AEC family transporter n=1 Tax=Thermosipho ferrireducens TaxID=2571116 RepID=A0ABX7S9I9_9BACT|nr:AEC family transporter [Thermosipho ferrireducens]
MISTFSAVLTPFLIILIGFIFGKIFPYDLKIVSKTALWLMATIVTFTFINDYTPTLSQLKDYGIGMIILFFISLLITYFSKEKDIFLVSSVYVNSGYLGYPVLYSLWGERAMAYGVIYSLMNILIGSLLLPIFIGKKVNFKNILKLPYFYTLIVAFILGHLGISYRSIPEPLLNSLLMLKDSAIPFLLLFVGLSLSRIKFSKGSMLTISLSSLLRLIIIPVFGLIFSQVYKMHGEFGKVFVLESAMPVAVNSVILMDALGGDTPSMSLSVAVTTLLSIITLPIWAFVLEQIF